MKFSILPSNKKNKITNQYVLTLNYVYGDCEDSKTAVIHIPEEKMNCEYLQLGLKILYTTLYSNTNYRKNQTPYYHVLGFDWICGDDGYYTPSGYPEYQPELQCANCPKDKHYYLDINFPFQRNDLFYRLEGINWEYYDNKGDIQNVIIEFSTDEIQDVCHMIEQSYDRLNSFYLEIDIVDKQYFTSHIETIYMDKRDPPEFLETSKKFWAQK